MRPLRALETWRAGRGAVGIGLVGSLLTCAASTASNAVFDRHANVMGGLEFARRLGVGYVAAALVVVTVFPLLQSMRRESVDEA